MRIAICITTRNRPDIFDKCYQEITNFLPSGVGIEARRFIVDDASDEPQVEKGHRGHRFEKNVGISAAKNKCLELADGWGADHIFLFDSDCWPIADDWWRPYVGSPEPHLLFEFDLPGKPKMKLLHADGIITAWSHTRGAMIYLTKGVLHTVGGFDTKYGLYGFEHPDFTNRIHNAGLTTYRAMDVAESNKLLYCLDEDGKVDSSISSRTRRDMLQRNYRYYKSQKDSSAYKEYRNDK